MARERLLNASLNSLNEIRKEPEVGCWEEILNMIGRGIMHVIQLFTKKPRRRTRRRHNEPEPIGPRDTTSLRILCCCCYKAVSGTKVFDCYFKARHHIRLIVDSKYFQEIILGTILVNSLFMSAEHHQQPQMLTTIVEYSNYFFTGVFTLEMMLKLFAHGLYGYIKDALNLFDSFIVIIGIFEILSSSSNSGISVLRTFRLLRILKVFRFVKTLKRQILVMVRTLDSVATFGCILLLFIFIFR